VRDASQAQEPDPVVAEYSRVAEQYDTKWSMFIEATTRETMRRLSIRSTDRVLDVGCGTGALLHQLHISYPEAQLAGVDPVPEMLKVARRRLPPAVELREGWADRLPYADDSFNVVVSCNMLHHIRHPIAALLEMSRVLRRGGDLIITDWCDDYLACRVRDWYLRLFSPAHVKVYRERDCLRLLKEAGFPQADIDRYKISCLWGLMTAKVIKHEPLKKHLSSDCS
jgi:ubiquinone/menaquinone biosynthesis C-methylase UbiE